MSAPMNEGLQFWRDLTPFLTPLRIPVSSSSRILIVGGGVTDLVTAWILLDKGYHVTIVAKEWASDGKKQRLTAQIAGAHWEFPPAVCGQHTNAMSLLAFYQLLSGVRMKGFDFFFPCPIEEDMEQMSKTLELRAYGAVDAYEHLTPIIDTDRSMEWLTSLIERRGTKLFTGTIKGDLLDQETSLRAEYNVEIIINATGLAGTEPADDPLCYPIRGGLIQVINDGSDVPKVDYALTITADAVHDSNEIIFIGARNDNILLIGGIAAPNQHELCVTLDSPIIKRMRARCEAFLPDLKHARTDPESSLAQGLRPFHQRKVRVERELRLSKPNTPGMIAAEPSRIVHAYGHRGARWSLLFGCAGDVAALVEEALLDLPPRAMALDVVAAEKLQPVNVPARALARPKQDSPIMARL